MRNGVLLTFLCALASLGNAYYIHVDPEVVKFITVFFSRLMLTDSQLSYFPYDVQIIVAVNITLPFHFVRNFKICWKFDAGTRGVPNI